MSPKRFDPPIHPNELDDFINWLDGDYVGNPDMPQDLLVWVQRLRLRYPDTLLHRFAFLDASEADKVERARNVKVRTAIRNVQSWSSNLEAVKAFARDALKADTRNGLYDGPDRSRTTKREPVTALWISADIPGKDILASVADLYDVIKDVREDVIEAYTATPEPSDPSKLPTEEDDMSQMGIYLKYLDGTLRKADAYGEEEEWLVCLDAIPVANVKGFHIMWKEEETDPGGHRAAARLKDIDTVTIVLNADGTAHLEADQPQSIPMAASFNGLVLALSVVTDDQAEPQFVKQRHASVDYSAYPPEIREQVVSLLDEFHSFVSEHQGQFGNELGNAFLKASKVWATISQSMNSQNRRFALRELERELDTLKGSAHGPEAPAEMVD